MLTGGVRVQPRHSIFSNIFCNMFCSQSIDSTSLFMKYGANEDEGSRVSYSNVYLDFGNRGRLQGCKQANHTGWTKQLKESHAAERPHNIFKR